jgi:hypothetical protein
MRGIETEKKNDTRNMFSVYTIVFCVDDNRRREV